jgi:hypothetical protein
MFRTELVERNETSVLCLIQFSLSRDCFRGNSTEGNFVVSFCDATIIRLILRTFYIEADPRTKVDGRENAVELLRSATFLNLFY